MRNHRSQTLNVISITLGVALIFLGPLSIHWTGGFDPIIAIFPLTGLLLQCNPLISKFTGRVELASVLLVLELLLLQLLIGLFFGGYSSLTLTGGVVLPLLAALLLGWRYAAGAIIVVFGVNLGILLVEPPPLHPDVTSGDKWGWIHLGSSTGLSTLLVLLGWLIEDRQRAVMQRLHRSNQDLTIARHEALKEMAGKSEMVANLSHEIRTPMNGVLGMTDLLLRTPLTNEQREYARTVKRSGEAVIQLINDILDYSKLEAGALEMEELDFDLRRVVEEMTSLLAESANTKSVTLAHVIEPEVPNQLRGDSGRIRQILTNLVSNAIKFTSKGEVILRISLAEEREGTASLQFTVMDTGIGIKPAVLENLFEPFTQADASTMREYGGTGLGLSICKFLVEQMGGRIGAESTLGTGSRFWFNLTLKTSETTDGNMSDSGLIGVKVLVVDAHSASAESLKHALGRWGVEVQTSTNAADALKILKDAADNESYKVVIVDLDLPNIDGPTLTRSIKSDPSLAGIQVLMMIPLGRTGQESVALRAGATSWVAKPVRRAQLHDAVTPLLGLSASPWSHSEVRLLGVSQRADLAQPQNFGYKLLLAEDNRVNQRVAIALLKRQGYSVDVVSDGRAAVQAAKERPFDAILMDCNMPELDGYKATAEIRALDSQVAKIPIIAMTASAGPNDQQRCLQAGMDGYVSKPLDETSITQEIDRVLFGKEPTYTTAKQSSTNALVALDTDVLNHFYSAMGDRELTRELITDFLASATEHFHLIENALANDNRGAIAKSAHTIKSTSALVGAVRLSEICDRLERASEKDSTPIDDIVKESLREHQLVHDALTAHLQA